MYVCVECSTRLDLIKPEHGTIVDCPGCGIEMEVSGNNLVGLYLGPSEE